MHLRTEENHTMHAFQKIVAKTITLNLTLTLVAVASLFSVCVTGIAQESGSTTKPSAIIHTSMGDIQLELFADKAPVSVKNFTDYATSGFYDGTIFHRVISYFMIQGGGFTEAMVQKPTSAPIANEANNGLSNRRGTIAMARTNDPNSATSQFFINTEDNAKLDYTRGDSSAGWGYAVFGKVTGGMDVVDAIRNVETTSVPPYSDVPVVPVVITGVEIISPPQD